MKPCPKSAVDEAWKTPDVVRFVGLKLVAERFVAKKFVEVELVVVELTPVKF